MNNMNNTRWKKLLGGGKLTVETPFEESNKQLKYSAQAQIEADRLSTILNDINNVNTMIGQGLADFGFDKIGKPKEGCGGKIKKHESGGIHKPGGVIVEDGETAYLPTGEILSFSGKEHQLPNSQLYRKDGTPDGIEVNLPENTVVDQKNYTLDEQGNLVKTTKNSVAMQRKALAQVENKLLNSFERKLNKAIKGESPADKFTAERLKLSAQNAKQYIDNENQRLTEMTIRIASLLEGNTKKAATGKPPVKDFDIGEMDESTILLEPENSITINKEDPFSRNISDLILPEEEDYFKKTFTPEYFESLPPDKIFDVELPKEVIEHNLPKTTFKDLLLDKLKNTSVGNLVNYGALLKNLNKPDYATAAYSQANSITNPYKGIGYDAEQALESQYQVNAMRAVEELRDIERSLNTAKRNAALSTNSLQEQRALALSSEILEGEKKRDSILNKLTVDADITSKLATLKMQNDTLSAQGQADAEMYAKNAIQNLYSQKSKQFDTKIEGVQALAEALNAEKKDNDTVNLIKKYGPIVEALMDANYTMDDIIAMFEGKAPVKKEKTEKE